MLDEYTCHLHKAKQQREYYRERCLLSKELFQTHDLNQTERGKFLLDFFHHIHHLIVFGKGYVFINWFHAYSQINIIIYYSLLIEDDSLHQVINVQNSRYRKWSWIVALELLSNNNLCEQYVA